ncbi:hypothetical protein vseg_014089 [Gypsophila vaccaria]
MATTLHQTLSSISPTESHSFSGAIAAQAQRSPWHSPVPYLFGGLAAMLGLIAFALLILACSYWRLSTDDDDDDEQQRGYDLEKGEGVNNLKNPPLYEDKIVVIMAGNDLPTFLAKPAQILFTHPTTTTTTTTTAPNNQLHVVGSMSKYETTHATATTSVDDKPMEDQDVEQCQH